MIAILVWLALAALVATGVARNFRLLDFCMQLHQGKIPCANDWRPFLKINDPPLPGKLVMYSMALTLGAFRALLFLLGHMFMILATALPSESVRRSVMVAAAKLVRLSLGLRVKYVGRRDPEAPCFVANHGGGFEGHIMYATGIPLMFLAMAEIRDMFLLGRVATTIGAIFVSRTAEASRNESAGAITTYLRGWEPGMPHLLVFPEGTTSNHTQILPFKSGAFRAGVPIQPIRIQYSSKHHMLVGNADTVGCVSTVFCTPSFSDVTITWLPVLRPLEGETPEDMAKRATRVISGDGEIFVLGSAGYRHHADFQKFLATNGL